jgi:hypothetical protein
MICCFSDAMWPLYVTLLLYEMVGNETLLLLCRKKSRRLVN